MSGQRQVEVRFILDGYFQVLLKLCDSQLNVPLLLAMLGELIFTSLQCLALEVPFLSHMHVNKRTWRNIDNNNDYNNNSCDSRTQR